MVEIEIERDGDVLEKRGRCIDKRDVLGSQKVSRFWTKFECYRVIYFETKRILFFF